MRVRNVLCYTPPAEWTSHCAICAHQVQFATQRLIGIADNKVFFRVRNQPYNFLKCTCKAAMKTYSNRHVGWSCGSPQTHLCSNGWRSI